MAERKKKKAREVETEKGVVNVKEEPTPEQQQEETRKKLEEMRQEHEEETEEKAPRRVRMKKADYEAKISELEAKLATPEEAISDGLELGTLLLDLSDGAFGNARKWSETERKLWAESFAKIFAKYMPKLGDWQTDIAFIVATAGLILPRVVKVKPKNETVISDGTT